MLGRGFSARYQERIAVDYASHTVQTGPTLQLRQRIRDPDADSGGFEGLLDVWINILKQIFRFALILIVSRGNKWPLTSWS
jgi:hypothetical protein